MWLSKGTLKKAAVLGLTVWFAVTAGLIQALHSHHDDGLVAADSILPSGFRLSSEPGGNVGSSWLRDADDQKRDSRYHLDYCPACLFLKSCNDGAVAWKVHSPSPTPDGHLLQDGDPHYSPPFVAYWSSRAPPATLT